MTDTVERLAVGVVGASVRAAVGSLLRAGFAAWAVDLFADRDLRRMAPCVRCPADDYPDALPHLADGFPAGPVIYTGGLENRPDVVRELAARRPLWGNPPDVLETARDPFFISRALGPRGMNFASPEVHPAYAPPPMDCEWLLKPRSGAGGVGIRRWKPGDPLPAHPARWYFQQFINAAPASAVFVTEGERTALLGVTEQLTGEPWLHAGPFRYAGNVGPLWVNPTWAYLLQRTGETLAVAAGLRGVWGIDFMDVPDEGPFPVEVNPRYTAGVEVLEHAIGVPFLLGHAAAFGGFPVPLAGVVMRRVVGKAIYFAPRRVVFPASGPWDADLAGDVHPWRLPAFADIPEPGEVIEPGAPVLTFFAKGSTPDECRSRLQSTAAELDVLFRAEASP
jgi:predicted ATP-grasp superfamily ATP-dependent carboligase